MYAAFFSCAVIAIVTFQAHGKNIAKVIEQKNVETTLCEPCKMVIQQVDDGFGGILEWFSKVSFLLKVSF